MANTSFRIRKSSGSGTPAQPPFDAWPFVEAPPVVNYPIPTKKNGLGYPIGYAGRPWTEFGKERIGTAGLTFYNALFESSASGSALVKVNLYDRFALAWKCYEGVAWRPSYAEGAIGDDGRMGGPFFLNFRMRVTELSESQW